MTKIIANIKLVLTNLEALVKRAVSIVLPIAAVLIAIDILAGIKTGVLSRVLTASGSVVSVLVKLTGKGSNVTVIILVIAFVVISLKKNKV